MFGAQFFWFTDTGNELTNRNSSQTQQKRKTEANTMCTRIAYETGKGSYVIRRGVGWGDPSSTPKRITLIQTNR
jgi:hypothetical protein